MSDCIFCKIAKGEIPSYEIYSDEKCFAFLDINPASKGHTLLIPKEHYALMPEMPDELVAHLGQIAKHIALRAVSAFNAKGVNIFVANGSAAGQNAPHVIIHIIPRYEGDKVNIKLTPHKIQKNELIKIKETIMPKINEVFGIKKNNLDAITNLLTKNE